MKKCLIIGAGDFDKDLFLKENFSESYIIAADKGNAYLEEIKVKADIIIGDFDSLGFVPEGAIKLPIEKDITDLEAAIDLGIDKGFKEFRIYGALGGKRFSHSMANIQVLYGLKKKGYLATIIDKYSILRIVMNEEVEYDEKEEGIVSFLSMTNESEISIIDMKFPLDHYKMTNFYPIGVSNEFKGTKSKVIIHKGAVLEIREKM